jgi:hypothetical protein
MTSSATASRRRRRARGLTLAVLLAAAQGSAWLHAAVVSHITCLEHGEAIHAAHARAADGDAGQAILVAGRNQQGVTRLSGSEAAVVAHEHCGAGALLSWRGAALVAPAGAAAPLASAADDLSVVVPGLRTASVLYLLAPKTSPPRAAV